MKRRILALLLAVSILAMAVPAYAAETDVADVPVPAAAGENYTLENGVELTFDSSTGTITSCLTNGASSLDIPRELGGTAVTAIGEGAFMNCDSFTQITIPDTITSIGLNAFNNCDGITSITVPGSVKQMDAHIFTLCSRLQRVELAEGLTFTGTMMFSECDSLTEAVIPESLEELREGTFLGDDALEQITLPEGVKTIGINAFRECKKLKSVTLPSTLIAVGGFAFYKDPLLTRLDLSHVTTLGEYALQDCTGLTEVLLCPDLQIIGVSTFRGCSNLAKIDLPASLKTIADSAFYECQGLTTLDIPDGVTEIGDYAFRNCYGLTTVDMPAELLTIGKNAFEQCYNITELAIPGKVTSIGEWAFQSCARLPNQKFPETLTYIGDLAFSACKELTDVVIPDSVTYIGKEAFFAIDNLNTVKLPANLTEINSKTFANGGIKSVEIPGKVTSIGDNAFDTCMELESVLIPNSVTSIGTEAFYHCHVLATVTLPQSVETIGDRAFFYCEKMTSAYVLNPNMVFGSSSFAFMPEDFILYGYPGSTAEKYAQENDLTFASIENRTLTLKVVDESGKAVESGFTVRWTDWKNDLIPGQTGTVLNGAEAGREYTARIILEGDAGLTYLTPDPVTFTVGGPDEMTVTLAPVPRVSVIGTVTDSAGKPISGAKVIITAGESLNYQATTGADGTFTVEDVPGVVVQLKISAKGYYSVYAVIGDLDSAASGVYSFGSVTLTPTVSDRISVAVYEVSAAAGGSDPDITELTSLSGLNVELEKGGALFTDFEVQGSLIVFKPDAVSAGDEFTVTVTDPSGKYAPSEPVSVTLSNEKLGSVTVSLVEKGGFTLGTLDGPEASMLLFDASGHCVSFGAALSGSSVTGLEEGDYSLVLLKRSGLLSGVSELSRFEAFGLEAGKDYLSISVTVDDGVIAELGSRTVPELDISRLNRTSSADVSVSKSAGMAPGETFMVRMAYELPEGAAAASQLQLVLPQGVEVSGAFGSLNGRAVSFTYDAAARTVTIPVNGAASVSAYIYCQAGTGSGDYLITGALTFSDGAVVSHEPPAMPGGRIGFS